MKKANILFAGLIILIALLLCTAAAAAPLTTEEILARKANGGTITEEEAAEYLDSLDNTENGQDLALWPDYTLDGRKIRLSRIPLQISSPGGNNSQTVYVQLENTYYEIADDVILVHDAEGSRFNGRPTAGTKIGLGSGLRVDPGSSTLAEGSKVLLLEKDGSLHAFYAGAGTDSSTLVAGKNLYIMRCFNDMQFHTPNGGVDIPISFAGISFLDGSGYIQAGEDGALNINIDVDSEWDVIWFGPIPIPVNYIYLRDCSLGITLPNLTIHMERYAGWFSVEVPLVEIVEPLAYGFAIDMSPTLSLEGAGEGDTILSVSAREGFNLTITDGAVVSDIGWNHTDPTFDLVDTDMEGDIYYGFSWGPALTWAEVAGFGGFYKVGVVLDAAKSNNDFNPDDKEDLDWHVCGKDNCLEGSAFPRLGPFSANIVLINGMVSIPIISVTEPSDGDTFAEYYVSKTFGDKSMSSLCPHWAYRLDVQVVDQDGDPIPAASVSYKDVPKHYEKYSSATTDGNGHAALCTATGKIVVTAELANLDDPSRPFTVSQTIDKKAEKDVVVLQLDLPSKHVYFKNPASGKATVWPNDITFIPIVSEEVKLPDTVPELSGRVFAGWNTAEDGSGTSYQPGTKLTLSDDLTLYAQWQVAGDSWYVVYNANGGTKAPGSQIVPKGRDAVLTTELPEGGKLIFKGWTPDPQTMDPVYQPGDTLKYDSGKDYVVLYALWNLSPVPEPIHISFSANGLQGAVVPADIWSEMNSWLQLEPAFAPPGSPLAFLGWSEDPDAEEPEFQADQSYYFYRDTQLFAVWTENDTVTLTFRDSLPGAAAGMPDPIAVIPSMSHDVQIPNTIPEKSGRVFTGWNTANDGSGKNYAPGSVLTLTEDTTLWAQWTIAGNSWYVIYNANGGTKAPVGQVIRKGRNAVLTAELPENGTLAFKGWALTPDAAEAEYQPGDTLRYSGKDYVVLYALWDLSPAPRPILVSFSANGLKDASVPEDVWIEPGSSLQLEPAFAPVGSSRVFLGWSEDPEAAEPEYPAGRSYSFSRDTQLFAVWTEQETVTLTFRDSDPETAEGIPDPITIISSMSRDVQIPSQIPEKSGRAFTGWNTAGDGSGISYAPGTKLTLSNDLTLWAQWQIAGDSWYVIYDANGGTKAPDPQIVGDGRDAVLTTELPEGGDLVFKGWTPDPQTMDPVYQPGDTLKYDSGKNVVVLYALWELSPVPRPILISFSANGLQDAVVPADVWLEQGGLLQMEPASAPVGSTWTFLGWSDDPEAKEQDYRAGQSYYFFEDTQLFAVWEDQKTVTLTFRDTDPETAAGIPDPISVVPSVSRDVRIPEQIPEKSGWTFTGWNTAEDGSGKDYAPGSVITITEDTTLWARWKAVSSWYVIYNANGGTKAPPAQASPLGEDAVLTMELPDNGALAFKGWAVSSDAVAAEYMPGDTLKYDSGKTSVVLYALWELSPAEQPVLITFRANGGLPDTVPDPLSRPKSTWFLLPESEPAWDAQHLFLGWSDDPEAAEAKWKAGADAVFDRDTVLYAVWKAQYRVISGAGSIWEKGSGKTQRFIADGNIIYFTELRIDGERFEDGVKIASGSTVADIESWAMEKLSDGTHTVTFVYEDGEASAPFIVRKELPPTGDRSNPALWLFLIVLGLAGITMTGVRAYTARKKH